MKTKSIVWASLVLALSLMLSPQAGATAPSGLKELTIGTHALPRALDPHSDTEVYSMALYRLMFDSLVIADDKGLAQPLLAESWRVIGGQAWQFKLRRGVRWHNGDEFTAADVKYSVDYVRDPKNKVGWSGRIARIKEVRVVDKYTVNFATEGPWSGVPQGLMVVLIVPNGYHSKTAKFAPSEKPVGTGMYRFTRWRPDSFVTLQANPGYWGRRPSVPVVTYRLMEDVATRLAALETGEVQIAFGLLPEHATGLKQKGFVVSWVPLGQIMELNFYTARKGPTADKRVRQAMNYAVDTKSIVENIWQGYGKVLAGQIVGPDGFGYNPALKPYPYDRNKARQLLAEAGHPAGFSITLEIPTGEPKLKEVSEAVVNMLSSVGIFAKLVVLERAVWLEKLFSNNLATLAYVGWQYMPAMDATLPLTFFQCPERSSLSFMCNRKFDELFAKTLSEFDPAKRSKLLQELAVLFRDEAPMIFLFQRAAIYGLDSRLRNVWFRPDGGTDFFQSSWQ